MSFSDFVFSLFSITSILRRHQFNFKQNLKGVKTMRTFEEIQHIAIELGFRSLMPCSGIHNPKKLCEWERQSEFLKTATIDHQKRM